MTVINKYKVINSLYKSQRTEVFRAVRKFDNLPVILKIRDRSISGESKTDLQYEYELGKRLESSYLVKYLALEHTPLKSILVLKDDMMDPLDYAIPKNGYDLPKFFKLALEIISAIEYLYEQKIVHKDINPTNIVVNSTLDSIKLIDFEYATLISEDLVGFEPPTFLQGTLSYISPEQTGRINKPVDFRSDLYSLGITFYKLITGKLPFDNKDPGELIYSQIAKNPVPVFEIKQDVSQAISKVIEKLMKKSLEDRYQTPNSVKEDLLYLKKTILDGEEIVDFKPDSNKQIKRIVISGKLYGRKREVRKLLNCFNKIKDKGQIVTVTGTAGIGKTALIHELYLPITKCNGFFLYGKFEQLESGVAYTGIAHSLRDFVFQCLGKDEKEIEEWKKVIQTSVGEFGQVLINIVPEFQKLIGKQKSISSIPPIETITRRNFVFSNLIKDICAEGYPIVFFIDNFQWADSATISLIETIIKFYPKNFMIVLSYRNDEKSSKNIIEKLLHNFDKNKSHYTHIKLDNLTKKGINNWINDIFPNIKLVAKELIDLIITKTRGNPYYIQAFLYLIIEKNLIESHKDGKISIDIDEMTNIPVDKDLIEHLIRKIENLKEREKKFLTQISILGHKFSTETLDLFSGEENVKNINKVHFLLKNGFLVKRGKYIIFSHNRVYKTACDLLQDDEEKTLHLKMGNKILYSLKGKVLKKEHIDKFIHHFNTAEDIIKDKNIRLELAKYNIILGKNLKNNAAYKEAEKFFEKAEVFLPPEVFETDYNIAIDLYAEYGEVLLLNLKYQEAEKQFEKVINNSKSPLDSAKVYVKQINHFSAHHSPEKAMKISINALEILGVKLPKRMLKIASFIDLLKVKSLLRNKKPEDILDLPLTEDVLTLAQMEVLSYAMIPAYVAYPEYWPIIAFRLIRISVSMGNCKVSPFAFIAYGLILCNLGDVDKGYSYGKVALKLMEKFDSPELCAKVNYCFGSFINHWKAPLQDSLKFFEKAISEGFEIGDFEFGSYAINNVMLYPFYAGMNIQSLLDKLPKQHKLLRAFGKDHTIYNEKYFHQLLITMNDPIGDGITISGDLIDENWLIPYLEEQQDISSLAYCIIGKMQLAYLAGDFEMANNLRPKAIELLKALRGTMLNVICHFFAALTCVAYYRKYRKKNSLLRDAKKSLKKLKKWARSSPENYLPKAKLVEAELLSLKECKIATLKLYETAIENASKVGNNLDLGIACECLGRYLISDGVKSLGYEQINRSIIVFENWGAHNKSNRLVKEFNILNRKSLIEKFTSSDSSHLINENIDLKVLTKTIRLLTSDLKFNSLLSTLIESIMLNSGATRVVYIHINQEELHVMAEKYSNNDIKIFEDKKTDPSLYNLPVSLIEKCYSDSNKFILENIKTDSKYSDENLFKSILIIPLIRSNSIIGLVYLENSLMKDAFREDHIQFITLLAGQAAITIENALVFKNLNKEKDYSSNIIQRAPSMICGINSIGITIFINPIIEKITGYKKHELIGKNWWKLFYPGKEHKQVDNLFKAFKKGEVINYEMHLTSKTKEKKIIIWNFYIKWDNNNHISEIICFGNDITKQIIVEEQLFQSQKMDAIGQLAGGIAHDFNNMLAGINSAAELLRLSKNNSDEKSIILIDLIIQASKRAADLTAKLLAFGRKGKIDFSDINIHNIINDTVDILNKTIDKKIKIFVKKNAKKYVVKGDSASVQNAFMNIVINASHAMVNGGELQITTRNIQLDETYCEASQFDLVPCEYVEIRFEDTGCGIPPEDIIKIFEPFYTTKKQDKGTGLGLSAVYGTVQDHQGAITVYSEEGSGSVFYIYFPCTEKILDEKEIKANVLYGTGKILLVDDEDIIRYTAMHMLDKMGYTVEIAKDGYEAVEIFKKKYKEIDIVIMDMIMPKMSGEEAYYKMKEIDKNCKIIIISGFTKEDRINKLRVSGLDGFLHKPFSILDLSKIIAEKLIQK